MNTRLILAIALLSGLVGGLASHFTFPVTAFAQPQNEIRAQSFVLVDGQNNIVGTIASSEYRVLMNGQIVPRSGQPNQRGQEPTIVILDRQGREVWRATGATLRQLTDH
jgi:hypothetical protein